MKKINYALALVILYSVIGCAPKQSALIKSQNEYRVGNFQSAGNELSPLMNKTNDNTYPLYQLSNGSVEYALGNYNSGLEYFFAGSENLETDISGLKVAGSLLRSESKSSYRGFQHERVMAKYYSGVGFFKQGEYEKASIAFRQALERDINKEGFKENSYITIHFMLGQTFLNMGDYEGASVAFRRVLELDENFSPALYKLAYSLKELGQYVEAERIFSTYTKLSPNGFKTYDGSEPYLFLVVETGFGPYLKSDAIVGQFATYNEWPSRDRNVEVIAGSSIIKASLSEDIFVQARLEKRESGEATRKLASAAVKTAASQVPIFGAFVKGPSADLRKWNMLPGQIHIALVPLEEKGITNATLKYYDSNNIEVKQHQQSFYYLPVRGEKESSPVFIRSIYGIQNQL